MKNRWMILAASAALLTMTVAVMPTAAAEGCETVQTVDLNPLAYLRVHQCDGTFFCVSGHVLGSPAQCYDP